MFSNFSIILLIILVVIYLTGFINNNESFRSINSNIYKSIDIVPSKMLHLTPPNSTQPNVDYQDYLNEVSGYDAGTRGYNNPLFAIGVAAGLDTN